MALKPNVGSDRSWVYTAQDYSEPTEEGGPVTELLAVRFANAENAGMFKEKFEEAQQINAQKIAAGGSDETKPATEEKQEKPKPSTSKDDE